MSVWVHFLAHHLAWGRLAQHPPQLPEEVASQEGHDPAALNQAGPLDMETVEAVMIVHTCLPSYAPPEAGGL